MKRLTITLSLICASILMADAQTVIYSLPSTTIHLEVEAVNETFTPGIYCKYAKKYLGIDVPQKADIKHHLLNVRLTPLIEADKNNTYIINLDAVKGNNAAANFINFSSQGLVILSDENKGNDGEWRFPSLVNAENINAQEVTENLTSTETTLYKNVKNAQGEYDRVAIRQSQVVEKSLESKAKEAASMIFSLRSKRMDIITGNTDATYSGEAMQAAIDELLRMEEECMALFIGNTVATKQKQNFDVVPSDEKENEIKIAFRISDSDGLTPADNISGKPIVIEIIPEIPENDEPVNKREQKNRQGLIYYRTPSICKVNLLDGQKVLLQTRIPIYQKGENMTFPLNVLIK